MIRRDSASFAFPGAFQPKRCQVQGFLEGQMLMHTPFGLSYPSIVASGSNANILHYTKNDDDFSKNEMMLIDVGIRWMTMHADITRTFPVSGRFNPMQKTLMQYAG